MIELYARPGGRDGLSNTQDAKGRDRGESEETKRLRSSRRGCTKIAQSVRRG